MNRHLLVSLFLAALLPAATVRETVEKAQRSLIHSKKGEASKVRAKLKDAVRLCDAGDEPGCADAYLWLGIAIQCDEYGLAANDRFNEQLLRETIEPLYATAVERGHADPNPLALEMDARALKTLGNTARADSLFGQAMAKRTRSGFAVLSVPSAQNSAPAAPMGVFPIAGSVSRPELLFRVEPDYSPEARLLLIQGTVVLEVVIDKSGFARDFRIMRALGMGLDENAVEAVKQWKFKPGFKDGKPVNVAAQIEVNFRLL